MDADREAGAALLRQVSTPYAELPGAGWKRMFGSEALTVNGRIVAFAARGGVLVTKLPADRCAELLASGAAQTVELGHGVMREWVGIPLPASGDTGRWPGLVDEAFAFVSTLP